MIIIPDQSALRHALALDIHPTVKALLQMRQELIDLTSFVVAEPGDTLDLIERAAGIPIVTNLVDGSRLGEDDFEPSAEWIEDHGSAWELVFVLTDDGGGVVLFVPDAPGVDTALLTLCRAYGSTRTAADPPR